MIGCILLHCDWLKLVFASVLSSLGQKLEGNRDKKKNETVPSVAASDALPSVLPSPFFDWNRNGALLFTLPLLAEHG